MKLRSVYKCHGGKSYLHPFIIQNFPENYTEMEYFEGCGGAASVLLNKKPSVRECYNDYDHGIFNLMAQLKNQPEAFQAVLNKIEYCEASFLKAREEPHDVLDEAVNELVLRRMSRGGLKKAFSWSERLRGGIPGDANAWNTFKAHLPRIIERLENVQFYCMDIKDFVLGSDTPNSLHYIDPPYLPITRRAKKAYDLEMTEKDHIELAEILQNVSSKVLLSGYPSQLYMKLYKNWNFVSTNVANHSGQNKKKEMRIECLWKNF